MSTLDRLAAQLAEDTLKVQDALEEDRIYMEVAQVLGAASQSLEEAYLTEIRVRLAERTAREFLTTRLETAKAALEARAQTKE
ncbi:hypothetical protein [Tritonibacter horizontis]|uniref:Uncharacterized protein n=1 Tax=Tritonibacter horizontis TaxID=1768241 RepID=A0A132BXQ3_9RHOB|nr:hypothetical protein [Tritonibacter horizontis]KUP92597.1 hypothetical protein TRIHO_25680 [Tritonibacter horizontis]